MPVFLATERLVLRQFTPDDVETLVELDGGPQVMRFSTGGRTTPREAIENGVLPWFLHYDEGGDRYGF
jgi:RimJ/RimL family protein N-acetyltransferase